MGTLNPGATYIYENDGNRIYAREAGSLHRVCIGVNFIEAQRFKEEMKIWEKIIEDAKTDPTLQEELDRVKVTYYLRKENGT
jgi:hypothetical protein